MNKCSWKVLPTLIRIKSRREAGWPTGWQRSPTCPQKVNNINGAADSVENISQLANLSSHSACCQNTEPSFLTFKLPPARCHFGPSVWVNCTVQISKTWEWKDSICANMRSVKRRLGRPKVFQEELSQCWNSPPQTFASVYYSHWWQHVSRLLIKI